MEVEVTLTFYEEHNMIKSKAKCEPSLLRAVETVELEDLSESLKLLTDDTYNVSENQVETRHCVLMTHHTSD